MGGADLVVKLLVFRNEAIRPDTDKHGKQKRPRWDNTWAVQWRRKQRKNVTNESAENVTMMTSSHDDWPVSSLVANESFGCPEHHIICMRCLQRGCSVRCLAFNMFAQQVKARWKACCGSGFKPIVWLWIKLHNSSTLPLSLSLSLSLTSASAIDGNRLGQ